MIYGKRLRDLTPADLDQLISEQVPEDSEIEFKETLPDTGKGQPDPWLSGGSLGDRARNALLEEIVAFANAYGGTLLVGVRESDDKPSRAVAISPVPRCAELAERLRLICRDCVEPQIPLLQAEGIATDGNGAGVVVVHVPKSMMGPHRHMITRECYARRADRSEKMTMREIRDLTLQIDRGVATLEATFERWRVDHHDIFAVTGRADVALFTLTSIPLIPVHVDSVHNDPAVAPPCLEFDAHSTQFTGSLVFPGRSFTWRPILRGTRGEASTDKGKACVAEVYCNGTIEYQFMAQIHKERPYIYAGWLMALVANMLCAIERFRRGSEVGDVEYALQIGFWVRMPPSLGIVGYGGIERSFIDGKLATGYHPMPRYSVGPRETFVQLTQLIERDIWNAAGEDLRESLVIEFEPAFARLNLA